MLNITPQTSSKAAKSYFAASDYFLEGQELPGVWFGRGAERLGLVVGGQVEQKEFDRLCDNMHPLTGEQLTQRTLDNRRVGYDFTFNAPKSVSLAYELTNDKAILDDFRRAVRATMREIEADVKTRVRKQGSMADRPTGNLAWAEFVHFTSRPVDGVPDPSLHAHCFAFNATYDETESAWKAAQFGDVKRDGAYFEAVFHSHLAKALADRGYHIRRTGKYWEIDGLPQATLAKFSRRTSVIEKAAAALGITDAAQKAQLGAKTREGKNKQLSHGDLVSLWRERLTPAEADALASCRAGSAAPDVSAREATEHAVLQEFERESVVPERRIAEAALRRSFGAQSLDAVWQAVNGMKLIRRDVDGRVMATSQGVIDEERAILRFATEGRATCKPVAAAGVAVPEYLGRDQAAAVRHVLTSTDRVTLVRGAAGTGKTKLTGAAVALMREAGQDVLMVAPSAQASRVVLRSEGFKDADTLARLLVDPKMQAASKGKTIWVDEAGLLGTKQLAALFRLAEQNGNRIVLMGDTRQHASPERGTALRLLERHAGLPVAEVTQVRRQEDKAYREAVEHFANGESLAGLQTLDQLQWVKHGGAEQVADAYMDAAGSGKEVLVVSPTHAAGKEATDAIRRRLAEAGRLTGGRTVVSMVDTQWTEAERADVSNYSDGLQVRFFRNTAGFKSGQVVEASLLDAATLKRTAKSFRVFRPEAMEVAVGDRIRITANGVTPDGAHKLINGQTYTVKGFDRNGGVVLDNQWRLGAAFPYFTHDYVSTSHASQGRSVARVILYQPAASIGAASREQAYVSLSRGREQALVITDDLESLREGFQKTDRRINAVELPGLRPEEKARRHVMARLGTAAARWQGMQQTTQREVNRGRQHA